MSKKITFSNFLFLILLLSQFESHAIPEKSSVTITIPSDDLPKLQVAIGVWAGLTREEIVARLSVAQATNSHISTVDPRSFIIHPKPLTKEQEDQKNKENIFERFKRTYTGTIDPAINETILYLLKSKNAHGIIEDEVLNKSKDISFANSLLVTGTPGNGKTYLVQELARVTQTKVLSCIGSDLHSSYKHQSAVNVKAFFDYALEQSDTLILFIDEADAIAGKQTAGNGMNDESIQTLKALLSKLDEIKKKSNLFVILSTNHPYWLEGSVKNRMVSSIEIKSPNTQAEYNSFFTTDYVKNELDDSKNESIKLSKKVWYETPNFFGYGCTFSRRELRDLIPIICASKDMARAIQQVDKGEINFTAEKCTIDIKQDEKLIKEAIKKMVKTNKNKLQEKPAEPWTRENTIAVAQLSLSTIQTGITVHDAYKRLPDKDKQNITP